MARFMLAVILMMIVSISGYSRVESKNEEAVAQEIKQVIDKLSEASKQKDIAELDKLYHDSYFHTNPDGTIVTKKQVLDNFKSDNNIIVESSTHDEDRVQIFNDTAIFSDRVILSFKSHDKPYLKIYRVTYVLVKRPAGWQVVTSHTSTIN